METILPIILSIVTLLIYCKLFMKAGERPIYALIPILNTYTLCKIVEAIWAFWVYVVAIIVAFMSALSGMPELIVVAYLIILVVNVIVYIRLLIASRDEIVWVIILIALELVRFCA